jgi:predicted esterase
VSFLAELRRRRVFRVAAAYAVVGWLLIQVASILLPTYEMPLWVMQAFVTLVIVGFPIALVLAWVFELSPQGVRRTISADTNEPVVSHSSIVGYLVIAVAAGGIGAGSFWFLSRDVDGRWFREQAIPQIEAHLTAADWEPAFALAEEAQARVPDDPELAELWPELSWHVTISSDPPGATVFRRPYNAPDDQWQELGRTPLEGIRIPFGLSRLKFERDGYSPLFRAIGGGAPYRQLRELNNTSLDFGIGVDTYRLETRESLPEGKVRVPAWTENIGGAQATFSDYFLDRTEVTNSQFKAFVDAGGYARKELWEPVVRAGVVVPWEEAMALLTDRTGRPGPSTWEAGDFPEAQDDLPVSGVSWYEAAAYARFMEQELPTAYHWRRARSVAAAPWEAPVSNLDGEGPRAVTASQAMSHVGAYDLAGNVREWTSTALDDELIIAGGSWNDDPFVGFQSLVTSAPPLDRSPGNGFRLAITHDDPAVRTLAETPMLAGPNGRPDGEPVAAETYAAYSAMFAYDKTPLNATIEAEEETRLWTRQRITLDAAYRHERVVLYLYLPADRSPPFQTVLYWPTSIAYLVGSIDDYAPDFDFIVKSGRALAFPVYAGTFERRNDRGPPFAPVGQVAYRDNVIEGVNDLRRSIDYLETRSDIDARALAYFGYSQGAVNAPIALAQEPRLRAGIAYVGFVPVPPPGITMEPSANPLHALPRVDVPLLLLSGEFDSTASLENARRYYELIGTAEPNKRHVITPGGHFVPRDVLIRESLDWLDGYLGPPPIATSGGYGQ